MTARQLARRLVLAAVLSVLVLAAAALAEHRIGCHRLYLWELPDGCEPGPLSACAWTPACRASIEDAVSRDLRGIP